MNCSEKWCFAAQIDVVMKVGIVELKHDVSSPWTSNGLFSAEYKMKNFLCVSSFMSSHVLRALCYCTGETVIVLRISWFGTIKRKGSLCNLCNMDSSFY